MLSNVKQQISLQIIFTLDIHILYITDNIFQPVEIQLQMPDNGPQLRKPQTAASARNMEPLELILFMCPPYKPLSSVDHRPDGDINNI